jgi:hypothetical protein
LGINEFFSQSTPIPTPGELLELQIEYWTASGKVDTSDKTASKKDSNKITLKTTFKFIHIQRQLNLVFQCLTHRMPLSQ